MQPEDRVIRAGSSGSCVPNRISGRLLPVEVNPAMWSVKYASTQFHGPEPFRVLPIAPEPDPATAPGPYQLTSSPHAVRQHLIDQQIEADLLARTKRPPASRCDRHRK